MQVFLVGKAITYNNPKNFEGFKLAKAKSMFANQILRDWYKLSMLHKSKWPNY
jgi:hypothetical protein